MRRIHLLFVIASALLLGACGLELGRPPLELATRDSLVGAGKIVRISNISNEELSELEIEITSPEGESRTYSQDVLGAYETLELGWKKLGGWQVVPGADIRIRAKGFLLPYSGRLGKASTPSKDGETPGID